MARTPASRISPRRLMAGVCAVLLVTALLPASLTSRRIQQIRTPVETIVGPGQAPIEWLVMRTAFKGPADGPVDPNTEQLQRELDEYKFRYAQKLAEIERLQQQLTELSRGLLVSPDRPVLQVPAPVIGGGSDPSSGILKVLAGRNAGVEINGVAVSRGLQLVGKVVDVSARFSSVLPITDRAVQHIQGQVYLDDITPGPTCMLQPTGDGALRGPVEVDASKPDPPPLKLGMTVRLADDGTWPQHAFGLVIGRIEFIEARSNGRTVVTVRPLHRVDRVSEVVLRMRADADAGLGSETGGRR